MPHKPTHAAAPRPHPNAWVWCWVWLLLVLGLVPQAHGATYSFQSVAATMDTVTNKTMDNCDDCSEKLDLPFNFSFGTKSYNSIYVSTNGKITFTRDETYVNTALPVAGGAPQLLPYWDDLYVYNSNASITFGTLGTAPNRRYVITWKVGLYEVNDGTRATFQVALFESGDIEFRYGAMPNSNNWDTQTVGLQLSSTDYTPVVSNTVMASNIAYRFTKSSGFDHLELTMPDTGGLTCMPSTFTITACANANCSTRYTGGVSGNLSITGAGLTVNYPTGAAFTIASGSSSTTEQAQVTTVGTATAGLSGLAPSPTGATKVHCGLGVAPAAANSCSYNVASAGFSLVVDNHYAGAAKPLTVRAIQASGNGTTCGALFANASRTVTAKCAFVNPASGTRAVTLNAAALNATNNESAACDVGGRSVSLNFDASGTATTTLAYKDVGRVSVSMAYTGAAGGADAGLSVQGATQFIAAPLGFQLSGTPVAAVTAGSNYGYTITAKSLAGATPFTTPNFGRETPAEDVRLDFARAAPLGSGAVDGAFTASEGAFSGGIATVANASWTEVGVLAPSAVLSSGSYLGSGLNAAGGTGALAGWTACANEGGTCTIPSGVTGALYYGSGALAVVRSNQPAGAHSCSNVNFGDPAFGIGKACYFVPLYGAGNVAGSITVKPHHFDVSTTNACNSFSHAGQPFTATVTARNAANATTVNYDGTTATNPNMARALTLSDASANATGSLAGQTMAASAFSAGVGISSTPYFSFTNKQTAPQGITLRAVDADGVSSSGFGEGAIALRSGRLRLANAFGRISQALAVPVMSEYWTGSSWLLNAADSCTTVPAASAVASNARNHAGSSSTATTTAAAPIVISAGSGLLSLAIPSPATGGVTFDLALNLGLTAADQSCAANHPASTGAARAWLRSINGSCAATADRDPAARASFGIYTPESKKTVHVREIF